jgi:hypothetical protein
VRFTTLSDHTCALLSTLRTTVHVPDCIFSHTAKVRFPATALATDCAILLVAKVPAGIFSAVAVPIGSTAEFAVTVHILVLTQDALSKTSD